MKSFGFLALIFAVSSSIAFADPKDPIDNLSVDAALEKAAFENPAIRGSIEDLALNYRINTESGESWLFSVENHVQCNDFAKNQIANFKKNLMQSLKLPEAVNAFGMSFENYGASLPTPKVYTGSLPMMAVTFYDKDESKYLRYNIYLNADLRLIGVERDTIFPARNVKKHGGGGSGDNHNTKWIVLPGLVN